MIALDTSAIVVIAMAEDEEVRFSELIGLHEALVGTPTLVDAHFVLTSKIDDPATFLDEFILPPKIHPVAFSVEMYRLAVRAFDTYGKGRGHPAKLNLGDCFSYAVAKAHDVPLLYKGNDFALTDVRSALK